MSAVLVNDGRILLATSLLERNAFFGLGGGTDSWGTDNPPAPGLTRVDMLAPIGYKEAHSIQYVVPDEDGEIKLSTGNYSASETPTNHLNYHLRLDYGEVSQDVRELHLYVDTETVSGLPSGQLYFSPAQIQKQGRLLLAERRKPLYFDGTIGAEINMVVTF